MKYRTHNPRAGGPAAATDAGKKIIAAAVKAAMQDIAAGSRGGSVVEYPKGTYSLYLNEGVPKVDVSFSKENVHVRPESANILTERIPREGSAENVAARVVAQVLAFAGKPWRWTSALKRNPWAGVKQGYYARKVNPQELWTPHGPAKVLRLGEVVVVGLAKVVPGRKGTFKVERDGAVLGYGYKTQAYAEKVAAEFNEKKQNPVPTFDTCPSHMDYDWWIQHYAPPHVREAARAQALLEAQRLYAPPPMTAQERAQVRREEASYGAAMRQEARRNPGVEQVILLVLPHVTKALGSKVSAFNALPIPERKARLRAFLQSGRRWSLGAAGGLAGPQIAKSDSALNAIIRNVEHYGSQAVARGGEEAVARLQKNPRRRRR